MSYRIPESFNAFCRIVSFTAAKTRRIFDVSVACVRLRRISTVGRQETEDIDSLRVKIEMRSVDLVEPPEQILRGTIHVVSA